MRFDNIFIPKEKGIGWTLNFENPISWIILAVLVAFVVARTLPLFKRLYYYLRYYR